MKETNDELIREQIEHLEQLPRNVLDKTAAWNKLELRMNTPVKQRRVQPSLRWAAMLLLLIGSALVVFKHREGKKATTQPHIVNSKDPVIQIETPVHKAAPATDQPIVSLHKKPAIIKKQLPQSIKEVRPQQKILETQIAKVNDDKPGVIVQEVNPFVNKLKEVHINDVFDEPPIPIIARQENIINYISPRMTRGTQNDKHAEKNNSEIEIY